MQRFIQLFKAKRAFAQGNQMRTSALNSISVGKAPLLIILAALFAFIMLSLSFVDDAQAEQLVADSQVSQVIDGLQGDSVDTNIDSALYAPTSTTATVPVVVATDSGSITTQAAEYSLTLQGIFSKDSDPAGSGSSSTKDYEEGATVVVDCGERAGWMFDKWTIVSAPESFYNEVKDDLGNPNMSFKMPSQSVTLSANWVELRYVSATIDFNGGKGTYSSEGTQIIKDGAYQDSNGIDHLEIAAGGMITINAGSKPGFAFDQWILQAGSASVVFGDKTAAETTMTLPSDIPAGSVISIQATWKQAYLVTITGGFGGDKDGAGYYGEGQTVKIDAGENPDKTLRFNGWTVVCDKAVTLNPSPDASQVSFTMPAASVTLTAKWTKMGVVTNDTDTKTNFLAANLNGTGTDLAEQIFKKDNADLEAINNGTGASIRLVSKELSSSAVSTTDRSLINAAKGDNTLAYYLDLSLYTKLTGGEEKKITDTASRVSITLTLVNDLLAAPSGYKREFKIIALHGSTATILTPTYSYNSATRTGTLTFSTDGFSTYAIVYTDTKTSSSDSNNNNSTDNNPSAVDSGINGGGSSGLNGAVDTHDQTESTSNESGMLVIALCGLFALAVIRRRLNA